MQTNSANLTLLSYPEFQNLPKGAKQMLLHSESYFFDEPARPRSSFVACCARHAARIVRGPMRRQCGSMAAVSRFDFCRP